MRHLNPRMLGVMEWMDDTVFKISRLWMWVFSRGAKGRVELPLPDAPVKQPKAILVHKAIHKLRRKDVELIVEPCPGIFSVLNFLKDQNIPIALVSNGLGKGYGEDIVQKFGLDSFFRAYVFREDIKKSKPHPDPLLLALQRLDIEPGNNDVIWYIGDRHKDIKAAKHAQKYVRAKMVPIAYGLNAALAVIETGYNTDHILMSYHDMYKVLKKRFTAV